MVIYIGRTHSYDEMSLGGIARGGGRVRLSRLLLDPDTASASVLRRQSWHSETMAEARSVSDLARHYYRWESPIQTTMYLFIDIHNKYSEKVSTSTFSLWKVTRAFTFDTKESIIYRV